MKLTDVYPATSLGAPEAPETVDVGLQSSATENSQKSILGVVSVADPVEVGMRNPGRFDTPEAFAAKWKAVRPPAKAKRRRPMKRKPKYSDGPQEPVPGGTISEHDTHRGPGGKMIIHDWSEIPW
jgi:hypothetical protein